MIKKLPAAAALLLFLIFNSCSMAKGAQSTYQDLSNPTLFPDQTTSMSTNQINPASLSQTVGYYRLQIDYSSSSDWSAVTLQNPGNILTVRLVSQDGNFSRVDIQIGHIRIDQPIQSARTGRQVHVVADYAISPTAISQPLVFTLQKGDINQSDVQFYLLVGNKRELIQAVKDTGQTQDPSAHNPINISLNLSPFKSAPTQTGEIQRASDQKMLWAFYYSWYFLKSWADPRLRDRPAIPYVSNDTQAIGRQIDEAKSAGIDGFISSWWGPGDITDRILPDLLSLAHQKNFYIAIYLETLSDQGARSPDEILKWLTYFIPKYRDNPAYMKIGGKPVIVVRSSGAIPLSGWQNIFAKLHQQGLDAVYLAMGYDTTNLDAFYGMHEYGIFNTADLAQLYEQTSREVHFYSLLAGANQARIWAAAVQPGYDDRLIPGRKGQVQARNNGEFYRMTFQAAIESDPDWIFITTWNEYPENTYIEPSQNFGDLYLNITRQFAQKWKDK
ncbi:MAG: endo-1,3-alpha-glucanase family glycosylhydrolase [Anaerolineaceae bacterium]|nr:endo-1,3-alpha-glucanase family glycosylhydrolase [Anaerolineaceae bacterium]